RKCEVIGRPRLDTPNSERALGLALPKKLALQFGLGRERERLIWNVDACRSDHCRRKSERQDRSLFELATGRFYENTCRIELCIFCVCGTRDAGEHPK